MRRGDVQLNIFNADRREIRDELGRFVKGISYSPETQICKGQHMSEETQIKAGQRLSPKTEFQRGQVAHNKLPVGSVTVRKQRKSNNLRAWVKVAEPNEWKPRAVVVWESVNGPLPKGYVVHHKDRDSLNDDIGNLVGLSRREHVAEHRDELNEARDGRRACGC